MTNVNAAATAKRQKSRAKMPRITEAAVFLPASPPRCTDRSMLKRLRGAMMTLYAAWRWLEKKRSQQIASRRLRISETISIGEKRTISIVTVDGAQFLIGSSSGGVQLLTRLDESTMRPSRSEVSR